MDSARNDILQKYQGSRKVTRIEIIEKHDSRQNEAKAFIKNIYKAHFGAKIQIDMPRLVVCTENHNIIGAMGLRSAQNHSLYLEQYLDHPIETYLSPMMGSPVDRNTIVEIGHLCVAKHGMGKKIIGMFIQTLLECQYSWGVVSATKPLARVFDSMKIQTIELAKCDPKRLINNSNDWGNYYEFSPRVLAGNLSQFKDISHFNQIHLINNYKI